MADIQGKRTVRRAQHSRAHSPNPNSKSTKTFRKVVQFSQVKGKLVEGAEFSTDLGYSNVCVRFQDKTCLNIAIDSGFTAEADYSDWKTGNQRVIRRWPPVRSAEFRV